MIAADRRGWTSTADGVRAGTITALVRAGLFEYSHRGCYRLTSAGKSVARFVRLAA